MYKITTYVKENEELIASYKSRSIFLWTDHMLYTRNAIISISNKLEDSDAVVTRLLSNQDDLGEFINSYYSAVDVDSLVGLFKEHVRLVGNLALADPVDTNDYATLMEENGLKIVNLMALMNPHYWSKTSTWPIWQSHMQYVLEQINNRKTSNWTMDISASDRNHKMLMDFANLYSKGTIYQNLEKFSE